MPADASVAIEPFGPFRVELGSFPVPAGKPQLVIELEGRGRPLGFGIEPASLGVARPARGTGPVGPWLTAGLLALGGAFSIAALARLLRPSIAAGFSIVLGFAALGLSPRSNVLLPFAAEGFEPSLPPLGSFLLTGAWCAACALILGASRRQPDARP